MKSLLILSCVVVLSSATRLSRRQDQHILRRTLPAITHEKVHDYFHQYAFRYITAETPVVSERGWLGPVYTGYVMEIEGNYGFIRDDGQFYFTKYRGGINGFHVEAAHLPSSNPALRVPRNKIIH